MSRKSSRIFAVSFGITLLAFAVAYALTTDQIWAALFDSGNNAIRVNIVAS